MDNKNKIPLLVIVGPTASGKTKLAIELAKQFDGEVVSADSMQIYKEMSIGTAKPTALEMENITHYLIDFLRPNETFSVAEYVKLAKEKISDIYSRGKLPILVGGTGLYINSLIDNVDFSEIKSDETIRGELDEIGKNQGNGVLLEMLEKIDPAYAKNLHENNRGRIIRAIEVFKITGKTMSWHQEQSRLNPSPYILCMIGLTFSDRQMLYNKIDKRVDIMIKNGLLEETDKLLHSKYSKTASQAIGYKELIPYFEKTKSLEDCLNILKQQSRRYAKRQLTWFRRDCRINWIETDKCENFGEIFFEAKNYMAKSGLM